MFSKVQTPHVQCVGEELGGVAQSLDCKNPGHSGWAADLAENAAGGPARSEGGPGVRICGPCSSALDVAWELHRRGVFPIWSAVLAFSQWAGRGQLRREWSSPPGNLYAALHWPSGALESAGFAPQSLSLVVGLCLLESIEKMFEVKSLSLKWPNDLLRDGRKVGGVLLEERGEALLAGIGLNLESAPRAAALREGAAVQPGTLFSAGSGPGRPLQTWMQLHGRLAALCGRAAQEGPKRTMERVSACLAWRNQRVTVRDTNVTNSRDFDKQESVIVGIDVNGSLLLRQGVRIMRLDSGSVALDDA